MKMTIAAALAGLLLSATSALALVGNPPLQNGGPQMNDQTWVYGLSAGQNYTYAAGVVASGTNQATGTPLPIAYMDEVDTVPSGTGVLLQSCISGVQLFVYNNGANALTVYPSLSNNPKTGAADTINGGTSISIASKTQEIFSCASNGVWGAK